MASLTKAELLKAAASINVPREAVEVPELGGVVYLRGMTGRERDAWEQSLVQRRRGGRVDFRLENVRARLVCKCLVDEQGAQLLQDSDAEVLGGLRVDVLSRLYDVAQRLSGVTDEDVDELKKSIGAGAGDASSSS